MTESMIVQLIAALVLATAPLLGWSSFGIELHGMSCGLHWQDNSKETKSYLIAVLVICYILPLAVMVLAYTRILIVIRKSTRSVAAISRTSASNPHMERRECQLVKLSCLMVATFFLCWSPYAISSFYVAFSETSVHPVVARIPPLVAKSEVLWNPLIYAIRDKKFQERMYAMLPLFMRRNTAPSVEEQTQDQEDVSQVATISTANMLHIQQPARAHNSAEKIITTDSTDPPKID